MKQDALQMSLLLDYYGELLSQKQRTCFDLYYNQDLSLSEIAAELGVSRQGVHELLSRAESALRARPAHGNRAGGHQSCVRKTAIHSRRERGPAGNSAGEREHKGVIYGI